MCYLAGDARIGRDCRIGPLAYVPAGTQVDNGNIVPPMGSEAAAMTAVAAGLLAQGARR